MLHRFGIEKSEAVGLLAAASPSLDIGTLDAVAGVEVQTEKVLATAAEYELPRLLVVNRMDRERASFERTLASLERAFGRGVVPLALPLGEEKGFVGVADLLREKADVYADDQSGGFKEVDLPEGIREAERAARDKLVDDGFQFITGGNASELSSTDPSVVLIEDGSQKNQARGARVAASLGLPKNAIQINPRGQTVADVIVILGADFKP